MSTAPPVMVIQTSMRDPKTPEQLLTEYEICMVRGHQPAPNSVNRGYQTWHTCKWCRTEYCVKTRTDIIEHNTPHERI